MPIETTAALRVDLLDPGAPQIIHAVQDDSNSRKIAFSIYAGGAQWNVPDGTLVTVRYKKPDGTAGFYDTLPDGSTPAATIDGNVVTVALVPQAFTVRGNIPVQIKLYDSAGTSITTFAVVMHVSANVVSDAEIVSSDYYSVLTKQIADALAAAEGIPGQVSAAQAAAKQAASSANAAAGSATEAASSASTASTAAGQAQTAATNAQESAQSAAESASQAANTLANALPKTGGEITGTLKVIGANTPNFLGEFSDMVTAGWNAIKNWYDEIPSHAGNFALINSGQAAHGLPTGWVFLVAYKAEDLYGIIEATVYENPYKRITVIYESDIPDFSAMNAAT